MLLSDLLGGSMSSNSGYHWHPNMLGKLARYMFIFLFSFADIGVEMVKAEARGEENTKINQIHTVSLAGPGT